MAIPTDYDILKTMIGKTVLTVRYITDDQDDDRVFITFTDGTAFEISALGRLDGTGGLVWRDK